MNKAKVLAIGITHFESLCDGKTLNFCSDDEPLSSVQNTSVASSGKRALSSDDSAVEEQSETKSSPKQVHLRVVICTFFSDTDF